MSLRNAPKITSHLSLYVEWKSQSFIEPILKFFHFFPDQNHFVTWNKKLPNGTTKKLLLLCILFSYVRREICLQIFQPPSVQKRFEIYFRCLCTWSFYCVVKIEVNKEMHPQLNSRTQYLKINNFVNLLSRSCWATH